MSGVFSVGNFLKRNGRLLLAGAAVVCFCAALSLLFSARDVIETGSWGLSFQTKGQAPVGTASREALSKYDAVYVGEPDEKVIYLTFDAGYETGCMGQILDTLKAHNVKACFFLVGNYFEQNPDLVRRMADEGHLVGNHTEHHYDMSRIADEATFTKELQLVEQRYEQITGRKMEKYYRPPQGVYSEENLKMAQKLGYRTVFWSLAYVDWYQDQQPTADEAYDKLLGRIHPGAIVLLHSTSSTNAAILDTLLTKWEEMGYRFGTLQELYENETTTQTPF